MSEKRKIRASKVLAKTLEGKKTQGEIAEELGVSRKTINEDMKSPEFKNLTSGIVEKLNEDVILLAKDVMERFKGIAKDGADEDLIRFGLPILRTLGVINEKQEHIHKFPEPTVIRYGDKEIKMGVMDDKEEDDG